MNTLRLQQMASAVYLAAPATVAADISKGLIWAAATINKMEEQNKDLAELTMALTEKLADMEERLAGEREIDFLASREEREYNNEKDM